MHINKLLEAGQADFDDSVEMASTTMNRRNVHAYMHKLGAGKAFDQILDDPSLIVYRGLRGRWDNIMLQNTSTTERRSQNTKNYVTLLTEVLPSWTRADILPRSKVVACSSSRRKASQYGELYIALPMDDTVCTYVGSHDFWDAFDAVNHTFGGPNSLPAINEAIHEFALGHAYPLPSTVAALENLFRQIKADLDNGELPPNRINKEMQALLDMEPGQHDLMSILSNALDPSHMRTSRGVLLPPNDYHGLGEEVAMGGRIVYFCESMFSELYR